MQLQANAKLKQDDVYDVKIIDEFKKTRTNEMKKICFVFAAEEKLSRKGGGGGGNLCVHMWRVALLEWVATEEICDPHL